MPTRNEDLHGMVPDKSPVAMIMLDVINDLEFPEGEMLLRYAEPMAAQIATLKRRCAEAKIPVVYVNDNYGRWQSDFNVLIEHCIDDNTRGRKIAEMLRPDPDDYFVLKPKHSGFFSTTLDVLLDYLQARTVIITGMAGNICVLFTANDAYMRDLNVIVPADCTASNTEQENCYALEQMRKILKADTRESGEIDLEALKREDAGPGRPNLLPHGSQNEALSRDR